ncbi:MAG: DUF4037 domain-containing protein [Anaerolineae bacterium]|nr:DUF4037 domain-containing protein [Anaerolineae bacterium]
MIDFVKGLVLNGQFYEEAVRPLLSRHFEGLLYSAALIGPGSDVLGYDTPQSMDHDWGPRLLLFLAEADYPGHRDAIDRMLRAQLPSEFHGFPTSYGVHADGAAILGSHSDTSGVNHKIEIHTIPDYFRSWLHFDPEGEIRAIDWAGAPQQHLLSLISGRVFYDGLGRLVSARERLRFYPRDVWIYVLAAQWRRIAQMEAFVGRCGQVEDEIGSRLVSATLVRDLMRLCFLMERHYSPYTKWFGTAFAQLACAGDLLPILMQVLQAADWRAREVPLSEAYTYVARLHNALGLTDPLDVRVSPFYERPFMVIHGDRFVAALRAAICDPDVLALPAYLGAVDQFLDSTDAFNYTVQRPFLTQEHGVAGKE